LIGFRLPPRPPRGVHPPGEVRGGDHPKGDRFFFFFLFSQFQCGGGGKNSHRVSAKTRWGGGATGQGAISRGAPKKKTNRDSFPVFNPEQKKKPRATLIFVFFFTGHGKFFLPLATPKRDWGFSLGTRSKGSGRKGGGGGGKHKGGGGHGGNPTFKGTTNRVGRGGGPPGRGEPQNPPGPHHPSPGLFRAFLVCELGLGFVVCFFLILGSRV